VQPDRAIESHLTLGYTTAIQEKVTVGILLSDSAKSRIRTLVTQSDKPAGGLRVKVIGGGCSGLQYKMDLDVERDGDKVLGDADAKLLIDRKSFLYLNGTELDYAEGLMQSGFTLSNPNVTRTCGCGASFAV
jgi:iron-sulfur cluster assembly protein